MRITDDQWVDIPEQTASTGAYSLSGGGLDQIATMGPTQGPVWDQAENAYYDMGASGLYSYDGGNSWEPKRAAPIPQSYSLNSPQLDQIATTYAGPTWVDNGTAGGKYVDQWGNESYDGGQTWMSPGEIQAGAGQPAFAPQSWNEPQPIPDTYSLGFNGTAFNGYGDPGAQNPWDTRFDQQPDQGGGFWGGVKDIAGTVGSGAVTALGAAREYVGSPIFGTLSGLSDAPQQPIYDADGNIIGYKRDPGFLEYPRELGSALKRTVTDPVEQYSRARQGTDEYFANPENSPLWNAVGQTAIDPLSYFGPGLASKVVPEGMPAAGLIRGLIDQGGGAAVLGGNVGATAGASEAAESIPLFGDQPAWLRGLEGGLIGGIGAMGAAGTVKATAESAGESTFKRALGEAGEATTPGPGEIPGLNPIRRKVADALDEELKWRNSGEAEAIKTVKRAEQASGLNAVEAGATSAETLANVSAGAKVGQFFENTPGLKLSETDYNAALTDLVNSTEGFDKIQAVKALDKLQNGTRLQPAEIKALGKLYGPEIEAKIRATNATRVSSIAELTPADQAQIAKQAEVDGRRVAILEAQAKRQHELADELTQRSLMNPTNKQLKTAAEDARARAIKAENDADRILADRAEKATSGFAQKTQDAPRVAETQATGTAKQAEAADRRLAAEEARVRKAAEDDWIAALTRNETDPYASTVTRNERNAERTLSAAQQAAKKAAGQKASDEWARSLGYDVPDQYAKTAAKDELRAQRDLGKLQDKTRLQQMQASNKARLNASDEQIVNKAKDMIAKMDSTDSVKSAQLDSIEYWLRGNRAILDSIEASDPSFIRRAYAAATGELSDSYTSALISRRGFLESALQSQGVSEKAVREIGKVLQKAELQRRFPDGVPASVADALDETKLKYADKGTISGLAHISQELKNTQFGIGDMAVFGQQGMKLAGTNAGQMAAGVVNRLLNIAHLGVDTGMSEAGLAKRIAYQLDGVAQSSHAITDLTRESTIFSHMSGLGLLDKGAARVAGFLTDLQFNRILTPLRNLTYEGNLVMAKLAGADISDAAVRARAAEWANAASGAGKLAQDATRAQAEKAFLLSPSMRRAQVQQIGQVARGLTAGSRTDRILAATTILSTGMTTLAVGKLLNDYVGTGPFEFDPSKKGFGDITLKNGTVINLFPQEQIPKAIVRSVRVLAEDGFNETDAKAIAKEWGKVGISSASPAIRPWLALGGVGIDDQGYHWGDMQGSPIKGAITALAPPILQTTIENGFDPVRTPLEFVGVNAYPESKYDVRDRQSMEMFGVPYNQQTPEQRIQFTDKNGKLPYANTDVQRALDTVTRSQQGADAELASGAFTPAKAQAWRDQYTTNKDNLRFFKDQVYADAGTKPGSDPQLDAYYKVIDQNTAQSGKVNWDAVDAYKKALPDGGKYIDAHSGFLQIDTPTTRVFEQAKDTIESAGFFEKRDKAWAAIQAQVPEAKKYASYDEWYNAKLEAAQKEWAGQATPEYIDKEARKIIDKMAPAKGMKEYGNLWENGWIQANPAAAYLAWKWGYFVPTEEQAKWINNAVGAK